MQVKIATCWTLDKRGAQEELSGDSDERIDELRATTYLYSCRECCGLSILRPLKG